MDKHQIYKFDKWNQMHVEVQGRQIIVRKISTEWGEETFTFTGRNELLKWAEQYFKFTPLEQTDKEYNYWLDLFKSI
ncbi:hypothetical protein TEPIDINF_000304 [Tepidibacillus infernus]|uniref:Uncharacterized protein n=1 Tax=Tepidibacillus decaturensis TaxID=1413211 RepID=A0A135L275_9BACI|nr:hypothetical protein [Tepidibacillus decaturensis]KXG43007.1 hypothetical protein U473_02425 [Tepidibacillus decaturensis]